MNDLQAVSGALCILLLLYVYSCIRAWRKKRLRYELKNITNSLIPLITIILMCYMAIGSAVLLPIIKEWAQNYTFSSDVSTLAIWLIRDGTPLVWVFATILLIVWIWVKLPMFKYSDKEKEWRKESSIKFREKLPKILQRFVKV